MYTYNPIDQYLNTIFVPMIKKYCVNNDDAINIITKDIKERLTSIILKWDDIETRRTLLFPAYEEAYFYKPNLDIDIRSLVVLGIRNSRIEDLSSTKEAAKKLGLRRPVIPDDDIKLFTRSAIEYFAKVNISEAAKFLDVIEIDPFGNLPDNYPVAWEALTQLANISGQFKTYTPVIKESFEISNLKIYSNINNKGLQIDELSGIDSVISEELMHRLSAITGGGAVFFSDCFKSITRNPDKLFKILEYVLRKGSLYVSVNYYIANGYVAKREELIKPSHTKSDIVNNLKNIMGLRKIHRESLKHILSMVE